MNQEPVSEFIAGGYFLTKYTPRSEYMSDELLPPRIVSASDCIAPIVPNVWAVEWASCTTRERTIEAARFGITPDRLPMVIEWVTSRMNADEIGWPGTFYSTDAARRFVQDCLPDGEDIILIGIGLHREEVERFLIEEKPPENEGVPGPYSLLSRRKNLEPGGEVLGFEVLGHDLGLFHSWLCNSLETGACAEFGIRPNSLGLVESLEEASALSAYAMRDETDAEFALWQPWLVVRYPMAI